MSDHYPNARFVDGDKVTHKEHGAGVVINHTDDHVQVTFPSFDDRGDFEEAFPQLSADLEHAK